ncbi:hypothetical protein DWB68_00340 [Galactobacter valiniphilus]|uniref:Uncharacterized protein n=1 Tax=Galactobacter valiniphilus TaxID=2676122 RepID=A0A399JHT1_9MICC|nr:hypothetical protein [Galactobacter valiniphilus]RII43722.1 hypothetical protein DWB68_00340 [Galactobacter valiniphilus]
MDHELLAARSRVIPGDSSAALSRRFCRGDLVRVAPRSYVETNVWVQASHRERFLMTAAGVLRTRPEAIFCGATSLALVYPTAPLPEFIDVFAPTRHHRGRATPSFAVHDGPLAEQARRLPAPAVRLHGAATTDPVFALGYVREATEPALVHVLAAGGWRALAAADAVRRNVAGIDEPELEARLHAISALRTRARAVGLWNQASPLSDSVAESRSRFLMLDAGLPGPVLQQAHRDAQGLIALTDFWWAWLRLVGEVDGIQKYLDAAMGSGSTPAQRIAREKARDNRLFAQGYRVLHWGWADLEVPGRLVSRLIGAGLVPDRSRRPWP